MSWYGASYSFHCVPLLYLLCCDPKRLAASSRWHLSLAFTHSHCAPSAWNTFLPVLCIRRQPAHPAVPLTHFLLVERSLFCIKANVDYSFLYKFIDSLIDEFILRMRKLRPKELRCHTQGHTATKKWSW